MLLALTWLGCVLGVVVAAEKRGFGSRGDGLGSFNNKNLVDWNSIFSKRSGLDGANPRGFGAHYDPYLVNWSSRFNKRSGFGGGGAGFGSPEAQHFTNWQSMYSHKRAGLDGAGDSGELGFGGGKHLIDWNSKFSGDERFRRSLSDETPQSFGTSDSKYVDWNSVFPKRQFGGAGGDGFGNHDAPYVNWNNLYAHARKRAAAFAGNHDFGAQETPSFVNWNSIYSKKRGFGNEFGNQEVPDYVNWNSLYAKKRAFGGGNSFAFGQPSPNSLAFHDWRATFARDYRGGLGNRLSALGGEFGEAPVRDSMVNWQGLYKRADNKDNAATGETKVDKKKDDTKQ